MCVMAQVLDRFYIYDNFVSVSLPCIFHPISEPHMQTLRLGKFVFNQCMSDKAPRGSPTLAQFPPYLEGTSYRTVKQKQNCYASLYRYMYNTK